MIHLNGIETTGLGYFLDITESESTTSYFERDGYWIGCHRQPSSPLTPPGDVDRVHPVELAHLVVGKRVDVDRPLNPYQHRVRYCALDMMFAAPKSVSVLHALGDSETSRAIEQSHRAGVAETMDFVERRLIFVRRPTDTGRRSVRASVSKMAVFEHRISRAPDPHLHSHVLVPNLATADAQRWSACDMSPLYFGLPVIGSLYRASLRHHLTAELGVRWREFRPGWYDLVGLSTPMVRAFSQARTAILADMARNGRTSFRASQVSAFQLRSPRELDVTYEELRDRWQDRAYRIGMSPSRVASLTRTRNFDEREHRHEVVSAVRALASIGDVRSLSDAYRLVGDRLPMGATVAEIEGHVAGAIECGQVGELAELWPLGPRPTKGLHLSRARDQRIDGPVRYVREASVKSRGDLGPERVGDDAMPALV